MCGPLAGGLQSWRELGFPVTTDVRMLPGAGIGR
jgi:hypothetical protein